VEPPGCAQELTMKAVLVAALSLDTDVAANILVSMVAVALGSVIVASPHRAARIWGAQRLANLAAERRASFIRWYRIFGIVLCLTGVLLAIDSLAFSN
jgi:hypothetical protein